VSYFEINADNPARAITFYENVFRWKITKWDGPFDFWLIKTGLDEIGIDGGIMKRKDPDATICNFINVPFHFATSLF